MFFDYAVGDIIETKKDHPCGSNRWEVLRTGADVKLKCEKCGRVILLSRVDAEKRTKRIVTKKNPLIRQDMHTHLERAEYTTEWVDRFVAQAVATGVKRLCLVEHTHQFDDFDEMYEEARAYSPFQQNWFAIKRKRKLQEFADFAQEMRQRSYPVELLFGMEVCYMPGYEALVRKTLEGKGFQHIIGSVHFVDGFGFDLSKDQWQGIDVNRFYRRYFENARLLLQSGLFDVMGHPDSMKLFGILPDYPLDEEYESLAALAEQYQVAMEQNGGIHMKHPEIELGMAKGLLEACKRHHVKLITASDAHRPEDVGRNISELEATL